MLSRDSMFRCSPIVRGKNASVEQENGVTDGIRTRNNQNHNLGLYR